MKIQKIVVPLIFSAAIFFPFGNSSAYSDDCDKEIPKETDCYNEYARPSDTSSTGYPMTAQEIEELPADTWFSVPGEEVNYNDGYETEEERKAREQEEKRLRQEKHKWKELFRDDTYIYSYDKENTKWVAIPYQNKKMIDIWVRLMPINEPDGNHYFLERYYIRRDKRQIMFLCELEVTGRPNNDIFAGKYQSDKWEPLVPNSIEDRIYHCMLDELNTIEGRTKEGHVTDFLEDIFRISI